jgi:hypothetical protein
MARGTATAAEFPSHLSAKDAAFWPRLWLYLRNLRHLQDGRRRAVARVFGMDVAIGAGANVHLGRP